MSQVALISSLQSPKCENNGQRKGECNTTSSTDPIEDLQESTVEPKCLTSVSSMRKITLKDEKLYDFTV